MWVKLTSRERRLDAGSWFLAHVHSPREPGVLISVWDVAILGLPVGSCRWTELISTPRNSDSLPLLSTLYIHTHDVHTQIFFLTSFVYCPSASICFNSPPESRAYE